MSLVGGPVLAHPPNWADEDLEYFIRLLLTITISMLVMGSALTFGCTIPAPLGDAPGGNGNTAAEIESADMFGWPVGDGSEVTKCNDDDWWYAYTDFHGLNEDFEYGETHLGEDWNGEDGGDTNKGEPVVSIGAGEVVSATDGEEEAGRRHSPRRRKRRDVHAAGRWHRKRGLEPLSPP